MLKKILISVSKENKHGYFIKKKELPEHILKIVQKKEEVLIEKKFPHEKNIVPIYKCSYNRNSFNFEQKRIDIDFNSLVKRIRPAQQPIFVAIFNTLKNINYQSVTSAKNFTVDLPFLKGKKYMPIRCYISLKCDNIFYTNILPISSYLGQPFYPRLEFLDNTIHLIPNEIRKIIYYNYLELIKLKKCPLHVKPRLMLRTSYTRNQMSYSQIRMYMEKDGKFCGESLRVGEDAIRQSFKKFSKTATDLFKVKFQSRKFVPKYWVEMGFDLEPIPELVK